jgi:hypothetical protein
MSLKPAWRHLILGFLACMAQGLFAAGMSWPTNQLLPNFPTPAATVNYIDISSASVGEQALFASLQGIVNRTQPRLALVVSSEQEGEFTWLNLHNLSSISINGYSAILQYRTNLTGLVVNDPNLGDTLNLATTIAGVKNELICDPSLLATLTNAPYNLPVIDDLRGMFTNKYQVYGYLYSNYWSRCTHRIFAGLETNSCWQLRDYLIALQSAVVWLDPGVGADASALAPFIAGMKPGAGVYLGWWPSESSGLQWIAQYGITVIASDFYDNGSVFSGVATPVVVPTIPPAPALQNKIYVSLILSDGDNVQYMQHRLYANWNSAGRGGVPIGWTVQPMSAELDPGMLNYYWRSATTNDCLVAGPSGAGYTRINYWPAGDVNAYTKVSNPYLQRSGIRTITVWLTISSSTAASYASNCPTLVGLHDTMGGYYTSNSSSLPVIGFPSSANYAGAVSNLIYGITNTGATWNGTSPMFIAVEGSGWTISPANCETVAASLPANYVVVRPDHLFLLYKQAAGLGQAGASPYIATPAVGQVAAAGATASFTNIATGTSPLAYQWRMNGSNIAAATASIYNLSNLQSNNAGLYSMVVTNSFGAATSAPVSLLVNAGAPQLFSGPQSPFYALLGQTFSNAVVAAGAAPLGYQWQCNGANLTDGGRILGSQSNILTVADAQASDAGSYQVIVSNTYGSVTSAVVPFTIVGALPTRFNGSGAGWSGNGSANMTASNVLTLTDPAGLGGNGSFFFQYPQYIGAFKASFTYQAGGNKAADGATFCIQNDPRNVSALGSGGGSLGAGGGGAIMPSVELELNLYSPHGIGYAWATNGATSTYTAPGSVNIASGNPINIAINYANGILGLTMTDTVAHTSFSTSLNVGSLASVVGSSNAYVGFTGAYGGSTSSQSISNFSFYSIPSAGIQAAGSNAVVTWPGATAGYLLQENSDLTTTNWVTATNQGFYSNNLNQAQVPLTGSNDFYRLILPLP